MTTNNPFANLKAGTLLELPNDASLPELAKKAELGEIDPKNYVVSKPPANVRVPSFEDEHTQNYLKAVQNVTPTIAKPTDPSALDKNTLQEKVNTIKNMMPPDVAAPVFDIPTADTTKAADVKPVELITQAKEPYICPNCSWDYSQKPAEITQEDKYNWLRATLGNKAFEKTYDLFGGKLTVTFRSRSMAVQGLISDQLKIYNSNGTIPSHPANISMLSHNIYLRRLNLAAGLVNITNSPIERLPELDTEEALRLYGKFVSKDLNITGAADKALFGKWSEALYTAVFHQFLTFNLLCDRLVEAATSPDFWQGTDEQIS